MTQKQFCIYATTAVGTIGGIILAPAIGPLALGLPLLMGLYGKKMAEVEGLDDTEEPRDIKRENQSSISYQDFLKRENKTYLPNIATKIPFIDSLRDVIEHPPLETRRVNTRKMIVKRNQSGLKGARGIPDNESYLRRHRGGD
jgi:hypothetical protein